MLRLRVITAVVLLIVLLPALFSVDPAPFGYVSVLLVTAAAWEWARLNGCAMASAVAFAAVVGLSVVMAWDLGHAEGLSTWAWFGLSVAWWLGGPLALRGGVRGWQSVPRGLRLLLGWPMLWAAWAALFLGKELGSNFLLSLLALVWAADIAAYFGGRAFGRRKLAPSISPGKSWAGVWSGMLGVLLVAALWAWLDHLQGWQPSVYTLLWAWQGWIGAALCLVMLAAMSVVGDLFESLVKRAAGAKDSSRLLPGHGGVLDRIDALLPVLPIGFWLSRVAT